MVGIDENPGDQPEIAQDHILVDPAGQHDQDFDMKNN